MTKFLIVDDTTENLDAAKEAAKQFPEHEFVFTNSATEALQQLPEVDGIITDLFFPSEGHQESGHPLNGPYSHFQEEAAGARHHAVFDQAVACNNYGGDKLEAENDHRAMLDLINEGTIRGALELVIQKVQHWPPGMERRQQELIQEYTEKLHNLPELRFPYGAVLMLVADDMGKRHVLVTDIHRHAGGGEEPAANSSAGIVLLLPLAMRGIVTVEELLWDGKNSRTYMASDLIGTMNLKEDEYPGRGWKPVTKKNPVCWVEAIRRITAG